MRATASAGLLVFAVLAISGSSASASALDISEEIEPKRIIAQAILTPTETENTSEETTEVPKKVEVVHTVQSGESLTKIATQHQTTWKRIFDKNVNLANPDIINPGDALQIPSADEVLAERPLPATSVLAQEVPAEATSRPAAQSSAAAATPIGSSSGNRYSPGYCTWYAKNMRPDLPNNLGNADTWVSRAAAQGIPTGSAPRVGAIGQQAMHVVYVQSVNGDGTVTISEMNYQGLYVVSTRTVAASTFKYIY